MLMFKRMLHVKGRSDMLSSQRQNKIMQLLRIKKMAKLHDLTVLLDVSIETVRRDIQHLVKKGQVEKIYGGIKYIEPVESLISARMTEQLAQKIAIAKRCAALVEDGDCIYIDSGTTTYHIVSFLKNKPNITVVTNSLPVAYELLTSTINVIIIGGTLRHSEKSITSNDFLFRFEHLNITKAFICASGVSVERGVSDFSLSEAITRKKIIDHAQQVYLAVDATKFQRDVAIQVCPLQAVSAIITDDTLDKSILEDVTALSLPIYIESPEQ